MIVVAPTSADSQAFVQRIGHRAAVLRQIRFSLACRRHVARKVKEYRSFMKESTGKQEQPWRGRCATNTMSSPPRGLLLVMNVPNPILQKLARSDGALLWDWEEFVDQYRSSLAPPEANDPSIGHRPNLFDPCQQALPFVISASFPWP